MHISVPAAAWVENMDDGSVGLFLTDVFPINPKLRCMRRTWTVADVHEQEVVAVAHPTLVPSCRTELVLADVGDLVP